MNLFAVAVTVGILLGCCGSSLAVDCSSKLSMVQAQHTCFQNYGLEMTVGSNEVHQAVMNDPHAVCRHELPYKRAIRCTMGVIQGCLAEQGASNVPLPDADHIIRGITYMCSNIDSIDVRCAKNKEAAMKQCVSDKALAAFASHSNLDVTRITCTAFNLAADCMDQELADCPLQTRDVYVHLTRVYLTPTVCKNGSAHSPVTHYTTLAPTSTVMPVTPFHLVTWEPLSTKVSCYSQSSIQESQKQCFQQEGISVELPNFQTVDGHSAKQSYLDAIMSNSKDLHTVCRDLPRYQRAIGCSMDVARQCMPYSYRDYLPGARQIQMMMQKLCDNVDYINEECVKSKASDLFDCGYNYGKTIRTRDVKSILCLAYKYNALCLQKVLPPCGYRTTQLYVDMAKEYLNAPACPAIDIPDTTYNTALPMVDSKQRPDRMRSQANMGTRGLPSAGLVVILTLLAGLLHM